MVGIMSQPYDSAKANNRESAMSTSSSPAAAESSTSRRNFLVKGATIAASFASAAGTASALGVGAASAAATQPLALSASGADEALFAARIHPMRSPGSLTKKEIASLYENVRRILRQAIKFRGVG